MGGRTVHHDAGLIFLGTAFTEFGSVRGEIQFVRGKEFVVLWTGNFNSVLICSRQRAAFYLRIGVAGNLVDGHCRANSHLGIGANGKTAGKVVETVITLGHYAHTVIGGELLVLDNGIHVVAHIVVTAGAGKGNLTTYAD